jgi:hypothetical protein
MTTTTLSTLILEAAREIPADRLFLGTKAYLSDVYKRLVKTNRISDEMSLNAFKAAVATDQDCLGLMSRIDMVSVADPVRLNLSGVSPVGMPSVLFDVVRI